DNPIKNVVNIRFPRLGHYETGNRHTKKDRTCKAVLMGSCEPQERRFYTAGPRTQITTIVVNLLIRGIEGLGNTTGD
ncbi:7711_t:CDS:1, partial [Scutellospora calospora]